MVFHFSYNQYQKHAIKFWQTFEQKKIKQINKSSWDSKSHIIKTKKIRTSISAETDGFTISIFDFIFDQLPLVTPHI